MLAENFKSPAELGLSDVQHAALVKVLGMLERGELKFVPDDDLGDRCADRSETFTGHFNMRIWNEGLHCGTVCCIAGTAELIGNCGFDPFDGESELHYLFDPGRTCGRSIEEAAIALRSYLTTGHAEWSD